MISRLLNIFGLFCSVCLSVFLSHFFVFSSALRFCELLSVSLIFTKRFSLFCFDTFQNVESYLKSWIVSMTVLLALETLEFATIRHRQLGEIMTGDWAPDASSLQPVAPYFPKFRLFKLGMMPFPGLFRLASFCRCGMEKPQGIITAACKTYILNRDGKYILSRSNTSIRKCFRKYVYSVFPLAGDKAWSIPLLHRPTRSRIFNRRPSADSSIAIRSCLQLLLPNTWSSFLLSQPSNHWVVTRH